MGLVWMGLETLSLFFLVSFRFSLLLPLYFFLFFAFLGCFSSLFFVFLSFS